MLEQGKRVRSPAPEEDGAAETMCDELTASPIPLCRWGEEVEKTGSGVEPGRREGWGEGVLRFGFTSQINLIHYQSYQNRIMKSKPKS